MGNGIRCGADPFLQESQLSEVNRPGFEGGSYT
jgi:hypothetical protein